MGKRRRKGCVLLCEEIPDLTFTKRGMSMKIRMAKRQEKCTKKVSKEFGDSLNQKMNQASPREMGVGAPNSPTETVV
jgi:hypothetical protein